ARLRASLTRYGASPESSEEKVAVCLDSGTATSWRPGMTTELHRDQARAFVEHAPHAVELMAAAQDQAGGGDDAVRALLARKLRIFLDAVDRHFRRTAEHRAHRAVLQAIDGVI